MIAASVVIFAPGAGADPHGAEQPGKPAGDAALPIAMPVAGVSSPRLLPPGDVPEAGLQIKTILAARAVSASFPQIDHMIGVRPDSRPWHPNGLAVDVMIPDPGSAEGIALGDEILGFALANAGRLGVQDVIWRGVYHTPAGPRGSNYGHFDHVHITTIGGGYPAGGEAYFYDGA